MKTQLSKLEDVDIRGIWDNESTEFTPWLAQPENIDNISEQIGIDLTVEEKEKSVGPYRADIFCKDEDENPVLIENQYGMPPTQEDLQSWVDMANIQVPVLGSDRNMIDYSAKTGYPITSWPTLVVIDKKMVLKHGLNGWNGAAIDAWVSALI